MLAAEAGEEVRGRRGTDADEGKKTTRPGRAGGGGKGEFSTTQTGWGLSQWGQCGEESTSPDSSLILSAGTPLHAG